MTPDANKSQEKNGSTNQAWACSNLIIPSSNGVLNTLVIQSTSELLRKSNKTITITGLNNEPLSQSAVEY